MSFELLRRAMPIISLESLEKLVLLVLCDCYNDHTDQCNPSRELIKNRTGIKNNATLTRKIFSLEEKGFIKVQRGVGMLNSYSIALPETPPGSILNQVKNRTTFTNEPGSKVDLPRGSKVDLPRGSELNHKPINEPINEPVNIINNKQVAPSNSKEPPSKSVKPEEENPTCTKTEQVAEEPFALSGETEEKPDKKPKTKARTFKFNFKELPEAWRKYCEEARPDIDPLHLFVDFEFYYTQCKGKDKYSSEKGWAQCWQFWVRRNAQQRPNQFLKNSSCQNNNYQNNSFRTVGIASNGAPIKYDKNGLRQSGFDEAYYAEDDEYV